MVAAPRYFTGAPDRMLNGVVLSLQLHSGENRSFTRFSMRPGLPLHSTLFGLVQSAAQYLASQSFNQEAFDRLSIGLTLLDNPMLHGTVGDPHLAGFEPARRAFLSWNATRPASSSTRTKTLKQCSMKLRAKPRSVNQQRPECIASQQSAVSRD